MSKFTKVFGSGKYEGHYITFEADPNILLHDYDQFEKYVKGCEFAVRNDDRYKAFISELRSSGYNNCAVFGDVVEKGGDKVKLEMHHGPIFNLFDYCNICLKYHLLKEDIKQLTTFDIADDILTCHEKYMIMICFLSKTAHKGGHFNLFVDVKATIGRIDKFIEKYHDGMSREHYEYVDRYIEACNKAKNQTFDNGLFDVADHLKKFN